MCSAPSAPPLLRAQPRHPLSLTGPMGQRGAGESCTAAGGAQEVASPAVWNGGGVGHPPPCGDKSVGGRSHAPPPPGLCSGRGEG